ncbi:SRPBCC domain-containing protein [Fulvivirga sp. M361]|uniref:SRPBCC domain-containing protein n=1 Tax=Fulvivirga sp. M361 TaxID=2594266 RepID=UPI0016255D3A|nr:SRPBCC domain-containing protein [Fulvivirga sp. M361]
MREIKTEIQISSDPDKVWGILTDLPGWANWNPIVNKIEGDLEVGAILSITMSDAKGNDGKSYRSVITAMDEEKRFTFIGTMMAKFIFSVERIIELENSQKGTLFTQREIYTGLMASIFWKKLNEYALPMLNSMNKALKDKAES